MPIVRRPTQRGPVQQPTAIGRPTQTRREPTRHRPVRKLPTLRRTNHNTDRTIRRPIRRFQTRRIRIVRNRTTITPRLTRTRAIRASPGVNRPRFSRLPKARARPWPFRSPGICASRDSVGNSACSTTEDAACLHPGSESVPLKLLAVASKAHSEMAERVYALQAICGTLWRGHSIPDLAVLPSRVRLSFL
jgi:hypothetical protein